MTLKDAEKIRGLLSIRNDFVNRLNEVEKCAVIHGEICTESTGYPLRWKKGKSREIDYLIRGYKEDIEKIDATIRSLPSLNFSETEPTEVCGYYI